MLGDCHPASVNLLKNSLPTLLQQGVADNFTQLNRIAAVPRFTQHRGSIGISNHSLEMQASVADLCERTDWYLATTA